MSLLDGIRPRLYVRIAANHVSIRKVGHSEERSVVPELAIQVERGRTRVVAVGDQARGAACRDGALRIVNPFSHPRTLVGDYRLGEHLLKALLGRFLGRSLFAVAPLVVMHPLGAPAGGFTQVELRALREMALGAGAARAIVHVGADLSDDDLTGPGLLHQPAEP
ncbi:MAG: rod shape-determining protein [Rhodocyclaceae bacterium]|nr:rod shape-determining protein [Rhodocyclaceae bacterium]